MTIGYSRSEALVSAPPRKRVSPGRPWRTLPAERWAAVLVGVALLPWLGHMTGVDGWLIRTIGAVAVLSDGSGGAGANLTPAIVFGCLHVAAGMLAGMLAALAAVHWKLRRDAVALVIALASSLALLFNGAQWFMVFGLTPMAGPYGETALRVWNWGGIVHGSLLAGGMLLFYPCLRSARVRKRAGLWAGWAASIGMPLIVLLIAWLMATAPARTGIGGATAFALYFAGAVVAGPMLYRRSRRVLLALLGLSFIPHTAAQLYMLFSGSAFDGAGPLAAVGLQVVGYGVPLAGLLWDYVATYTHDARLLRRLRDEVKVRGQAETRASDLAESLEQRVMERTTELERALADLDEFARMASHDLQEPLNKQVMFANVLVESAGVALPPNARLAVDAIDAGAQRMQSLIKDLMALARSGNTPLEMRAVKLDQCVDEALEELEPRIAAYQADVAASGLPAVYGDSVLLKQLFVNLIGNAIKFVGADRTPVIRITAEDWHGQPCISIQDNGIGIAADAVRDVFQPFYRLHPRHVYDGSGLGLSICRKIVERHGGTIWCDSKPGAGSRFRFTLPRPGA